MEINDKAKAFLRGLPAGELHQMLILGGEELWREEETTLAIVDELDIKLAALPLGHLNLGLMKIQASSVRRLIEVRRLMRQGSEG